MAVTSANYITHGGAQSWAPPIIFRNASLYGFVLKGDRKRMQALINRLLNEACGGALDYAVISDYALLYFADFPHSYFESMSNMGWSSEREVGIWVPLVQLRTSAEGKKVVQLCCFTPYIFVDNPVALTTGRDVFGFFKEYGWIDMPASVVPSNGFRLETIAAKTYSADTQIKRLPLLALQPGAANAARADSRPWTALRDAAECLGRVMGLPQGIEQTGATWPDGGWDQLIESGSPLVFLKQFRSISATPQACYQAIAQVSAQVDNFRGMELEPAYSFQLEPLASHPITSELGLADQRAQLAFRVGFDMTFPGGEVLWTAGA